MHHYAHHQELKEYYTVVAACGIWCCKDVKSKICKLGRICVLSIKYRVLSRFVIRSKSHQISTNMFVSLKR